MRPTCYLASGLFLHPSYARYYWLVLALVGAAALIVGRATAAEEPAPAGSSDHCKAEGWGPPRYGPKARCRKAAIWPRVTFAVGQ
jgi:hypothetical protein